MQPFLRNNGAARAFVNGQVVGNERLLWPFPAEAIAQLLQAAKNLIIVEDNYTSQLGRLIAEQTGIRIQRQVLKYDGRAFSQTEIESAIEQHVAGAESRLVISSP